MGKTLDTLKNVGNGITVLGLISGLVLSEQIGQGYQESKRLIYDLFRIKYEKREVEDHGFHEYVRI